MALDANTLAGLITAQLAAAAPISTPAQLAQAIAVAVVAHLQADAVVLPTALVSPAGPVTGTGKVG